MLKAISDCCEQHIGQPASPADEAHRLQPAETARLIELLPVPHGDYLAARMRAREAAG